MPYANNKSADQPVSLHSLISAFVVRCLDTLIPLLAIAEFSRPQLVSSAEQDDLSLTWLKTQKTGFLVTGLMFFVSERHCVIYPGVSDVFVCDILVLFLPDRH